MKNWVDFNETEKQRKMRKISNPKSWLFGRMNKITRGGKDRALVSQHVAPEMRSKEPWVTVRLGGKSGVLFCRSQKSKEREINCVKCNCWIFQHRRNCWAWQDLSWVGGYKHGWVGWSKIEKWQQPLTNNHKNFF